MTTMQETNDLLMGGGGSKAAAFNAIGDSVTGFVVALDSRQATVIGSASPAFWPDGNKKMVSIITLQTEEHDDEEDDGQRAVWVPIPSQIRTVIADAVRKAGEKGIEDGTLHWSAIDDSLTCGERTETAREIARQDTADALADLLGRQP